MASKQIEPEEGRFKEESKYPLGCQRRAEDIADEFRVSSPVGPELEFHNDPGGYSHHKGNPQQLAKKDPYLLVHLLTGLIALNLDQDQQPGQADGDWGKDIVKTYGEGKLQTGKQDNIQFH